MAPPPGERVKPKTGTPPGQVKPKIGTWPSKLQDTHTEQIETIPDMIDNVMSENQTNKWSVLPDSETGLELLPQISQQNEPEPKSDNPEHHGNEKVKRIIKLKPPPPLRV